MLIHSVYWYYVQHDQKALNVLTQRHIKTTGAILTFGISDVGLILLREQCYRLNISKHSGHESF